jgi:hypothetical protein
MTRGRAGGSAANTSTWTTCLRAATATTEEAAVPDQVSTTPVLRHWPSEAAQQAAYAATQRDDGLIPVSDLALTFEALHDPALGLDRSVCLRDVVNALRQEDPSALKGFWPALHFIEDQFGVPDAS